MTARGVPFAIRDGETTTLSVPLRAAVVRHVAFRLPPGVPEHELTSTIACRGALVVGGELGVHDRGFESTADGAGIVTAMLAADEYTLRVVAGTRRFAGKFALAGDDGVGEPVWVELHEEAGGG
jgi:hypothetical protein